MDYDILERIGAGRLCRAYRLRLTARLLPAGIHAPTGGCGWKALSTSFWTRTMLTWSPNERRICAVNKHDTQRLAQLGC